MDEMNERSDRDLLQAVQKCLDDLARRSPEERFQRMIDRGLIDEHGRLRRDPIDDGTDSEASAARNHG